ncbi:hypothetical protein ABZV67_42040 [Streptomyces sp. NPDC005065]|uniref:hypothetical protein n=1 Tax=Streptomyces sp. NPDC005065 TaxID=3154461 RepID=UPI0033B9A03D
MSKGIRTPEIAPKQRGGHLVLVCGRTYGGLVFNNPSGHTPQSREAVLPLDQFELLFGGRGVSLDLRPLSSSSRLLAVSDGVRPMTSE